MAILDRSGYLNILLQNNNNNNNVHQKEHILLSGHLKNLC